MADKKEPKNVGRPSKLSPEVVKKLEEAFSIDATVSEACYYCDISRETFYNWMKADKELFDRLERMRQKPVLKARQVVVNGIKNDKDFALRYLTKKKKSEFGDKLELGGEVEFFYNLKVIEADDGLNIDEKTKGSV